MRQGGWARVSFPAVSYCALSGVFARLRTVSSGESICRREVVFDVPAAGGSAKFRTRVSSGGVMRSKTRGPQNSNGPREDQPGIKLR